MTLPCAHDLAALIDVPRLSAWLDEHIPALGDAPLEARIIHGGTSNVIISLDRGGQSMVLRRPPAVPPPGSEKTVLREARVLRALNGTPVPHPVCYGDCADTAVIGAPFYVMERVCGWPGELRDDRIHHRPPFDRMPYEYGIPFAAVDGLIALANVDYRAVGLEGFGKPENFLARQVDRWTGQLASYRKLYNYAGRDLPGFELTAQWLRDHVPADFRPGIMHGDVATANMLFAPDPPARLTALIDWELSTIGDPLLDLAWFCNSLRDERSAHHSPAKSHYNVDNWPTRQELVRYYCAGTGRDASHFDYYLILAKFKGGCILEYKVAQAAAGILPRETGEYFSRMVLSSFAESAKLIHSIG
ncbi:MAG TPA: phosphotransferase family protein [Steroidobacteraceae bacterium]|nr:phosphotransferase family protein [Steroidobacteraceae bacterium]